MQRATTCGRLCRDSGQAAESAEAFLSRWKEKHADVVAALDEAVVK